MIDLRKTYCKLDSGHIEEYKSLIREQGLISIHKESIDDMRFGLDCLGVDGSNKTHCDSLIYCQRCGYTEFTGNQNNTNKHPHHDLVVEWANDTSKQLQIKTLADDVEWEDCSILAVIENPKFLARLKPQREFIKGHWYPCIYEGMKGVVEFIGNDQFISNTMARGKFKSNEMEWIGESLGEIEFGGFDV